MNDEYPTIYPEETPQDGCLGTMLFAAGFLIMLLMCALLGSCSRVVYVPQESVRHDSIYLTKVQRDSVYLKEFVNVWQKADTVYRDRLITKYRERLNTDTLYVERTDTVRIPVPVERQLGKGERTLISLGKISLGVYAGLILAAVLYFIWRRYGPGNES